MFSICEGIGYDARGVVKPQGNEITVHVRLESRCADEVVEAESVRGVVSTEKVNDERSARRRTFSVQSFRQT